MRPRGLLSVDDDAIKAVIYKHQQAAEEFGELFIYRDKDSGNTRTIFGYPTERTAQQISKTLG